MISGQIQKVKFVHESAEMFWSVPTQSFIDRDIHNPQKKWIFQILEGQREKEKVKFQDDDFLLIPDFKNIYKRVPRSRKKTFPVFFNWMVIVKDMSLRNVRDLRGHHIPLLQKIKDKSVEILLDEFPGVQAQDIMIFANYPPSVHRLHFHLCFPFFFSNAYDAFRVHCIDQIINNLQINSDYYYLSNFTFPVYEKNPLTKLYLQTNETVTN